MTTSDKVREILIQEGGFRELPSPLIVGSLSFDFGQALVGGEKSNDLVIVIELNTGVDDAEVVRKIFALTRALDVLRSRRSVTVVLTLGQAHPDVVRSLGSVCRVLSVGSPSGSTAQQELRDWLSALLPLTLPPTVDETENWQAEVGEKISNPDDEGFIEELLRQSGNGEDAIKQILSERVIEAVRIPLAEKQEND